MKYADVKRACRDHAAALILEETLERNFFTDVLEDQGATEDQAERAFRELAKEISPKRSRADV